MSPSRVYPRRFCIDANLSYKVAAALATVGYPVIHVSEQFPHPSQAGQSNAPDEKIAEWIGKTEYVLVTADAGFHGRWARLGVLQKFGVEVVVFDGDIPGLKQQLKRLVGSIDGWIELLEAQPFGHRIWVRPKRGPLLLHQGKKAKQKSRIPNPPKVRGSTSSDG